jgi:hypothetical protein
MTLRGMRKFGVLTLNNGRRGSLNKNDNDEVIIQRGRDEAAA